jgi:hypothetical protein
MTTTQFETKIVFSQIESNRIESIYLDIEKFIEHLMRISAGTKSIGGRRSLSKNNNCEKDDVEDQWK